MLKHDQADFGQVRHAGQVDVAADVFAEKRVHTPVFTNDPPDCHSDRDTAAPFDLTALQPGECVGPYVVQKELGEGGMGKVYMAQREDDFAMKVAIKVVRSNDPDIVRRFHKERRILARINFPNTARMVDGGVLPSGNPYLIMEYIEGRELDHYCDGRNMSVEARLRLFLKICDIVSLAHRSLILHRDLKPANILVTEAGRPKLLDFGIAALMDEETGLQQATTVWAPRAMTPQYASPEQWRGEVLTAATDVYSMGVILYEMLTGRRPYAMTGNDPLAMYHQLMDKPPSRPSSVFKGRTRAGGKSATAASVPIDQLSSKRGMAPRRLAKLLDGDLDSIVLKALEKDPRQRYSSMEMFARDIHRYLTGRPVLARSGTNRYLAVKWLKRNRMPVMVGSFVFFMLLGVALWSVYQRKQTEIERDRAQAAKLLAEKERAAAEQVSAFTVGLFAESDPEAVLAGQLSVAELVHRGTAKIQQSLHRDPEARARLMAVLGQVHASIGSFETAEQLYRESLSYFRKKGGPDQVAGVLCGMGKSFLLKGDLNQARTFLLEAKEVVANGGVSVENQELIARQMVRFFMTTNEYALMYDALRLLDDVYCENAAVFGEFERLVLLNEYGRYFTATGDFKAAEAYLTDAMEGFANLGEAREVNMMQAMESLAYLREAQGLHQKALMYRERIIEYNQRLYGDDSVFYARAIRGAAPLYGRIGEPQKALEYAHKALDIFERKTGITKDTLIANNIVGFAYQSNANFEESLRYARKSLSLSIAVNGEEAEDTAVFAHNLGFSLYQHGDFKNAEKYIGQAIDLLHKVHHGDHPHGFMARLNQTYLMMEMGSLEKALDICLKLEASLEKFEMGRSGMYYDNLINKMQLWIMVGDSEKTIDLVDQYLGKFKHLKQRALPVYSQLNFLKGFALMSLNKKSEAQTYLDEAWPFYEDHTFALIDRSFLDQMVKTYAKAGFVDRAELLRRQRE